jgi:hypothetical protein
MPTWKHVRPERRGDDRRIRCPRPWSGLATHCYVSLNGDASELVCSCNVPRSNPRNIDRRPPRRLVGSVMDARRSAPFDELSLGLTTPRQRRGPAVQVLTTPRRSRGRAVEAVLPMLGLTVAQIILPPHDV